MQEGQQLAQGTLAQEGWGLCCTWLGGVEHQSSLCPGSQDMGAKVGHRARLLWLP